MARSRCKGPAGPGEFRPRRGRSAQADATGSSDMRSIVVAGVMSLAAAGSAAAQGSDFQWKGKLAQGKTIEIRGVNGDVRAMTTTGTEVEVSAIKRARRSDPDEVEIKVFEHEGGVTICAIYRPSRRSSR